VQVNGKLRARVTIAADATEEDLRSAALAEANVARHLQDVTVAKIIVVPPRLVNIVTR
jgi:leucyl-tRNA synthetase